MPSSVDVAVITWSFSSGVVTVTVQLPLASAVTVLGPSGVSTVTVATGVAEPVIVVSPALGWVIVGFFDFSFSLTVVVTSSEGFLPFSVALAVITWSFTSGVVTVTVQFPSLSAVVVFSPSGVVTVTVALGVAVPVIVVSPSVGWLIFGAGVVSFALTVVVASFDGFFPSSVAFAVITWSFSSGVVTVTVQLPLLSAVVVLSPSGVVTVTVALGVAVPVIVVSPSVGWLISGVAEVSIWLNVAL